MATGHCEGEEEASVRAEVTEVVESDGVEQCNRFCNEANRLVANVLNPEGLNQDSVLVEVELLPFEAGQQSIKWIALVKRAPKRELPSPFPSPEAIARYIVPSAFYDSRKSLYELARSEFVKVWPEVGNTVEGVPVVWLPFDSSDQLEFKGKNEPIKDLIRRIQSWDEQFVVLDQAWKTACVDGPTWYSAAEATKEIINRQILSR